MSALNKLLGQWASEGKLDTRNVPKDELAMTLVLLYLRGNVHDTKQAFCKTLTDKKPVHLGFQRAVLIELYTEFNNLKVTPAVIETIYERTLAESPLRKFAVRCWLNCWCKDRNEFRTMPAEFQEDLAAAEQKRGCKPGWVMSYVMSFLDRMELIGIGLDADAEVQRLKNPENCVQVLKHEFVVGGICPDWCLGRSHAGREDGNGRHRP